MKKPIALYYLYCMDMKCNLSIFHHNVEVRMPFTAENLAKVHLCSYCNGQLISGIDIEIKHVVTEVNMRNMVIPDYLKN